MGKHKKTVLRLPPWFSHLLFRVCFYILLTPQRLTHSILQNVRYIFFVTFQVEQIGLALSLLSSSTSLNFCLQDFKFLKWGKDRFGDRVLDKAVFSGIFVSEIKSITRKKKTISMQFGVRWVSSYKIKSLRM